MGAVYRVWDLKRNVTLAMKVLHGDLAEDPSIFKKFQREANALKKLSHPHIVPFYDIRRLPDEYAILLEKFIDGGSLREVLRQQKGKPLQIQESLIYLKAMCAALGYAHSCHVVHCDVKPGNIMIDQGGDIYLTDFGVARHSNSDITTMGTFGTPAYMAPEQILGHPVTPATDVYALGVMLFEMLTGQRPFRGDNEGTDKSGETVQERIRHGHLNLPPPDPRSINSSISVPLSMVVLQALSKDPTQRYHSTESFFDAVCGAVGGYSAKVSVTFVQNG
jgi:serine/threonine-protein kinase